MKNTGKLKASSPTNSRRAAKHLNSGRGTPQVNSGRQTAQGNVYEKNLEKYNWICARVLQAGVACAISFALGKQQSAEQVHHVYPRLRAPQYIWDENFLLPLTCEHHVKVEKEEEKLVWEREEVIINGHSYKMDLEEFRKVWKEFRLKYEEKYKDVAEIEEDQAF